MSTKHLVIRLVSHSSPVLRLRTESTRNDAASLLVFSYILTKKCVPVSYLQNVHKRLMVILLYNFFVNTTCGKPCEFKNNSRNTAKIFCVPVATKSCHGYYISLINNSFYQKIFYIRIYIYI